MTNPAPIEAVLLTDVGRVRDHNEDFFSSREPAGAEDEARNGWLYIVADGVGGAEAGEVASSYACERTIHHFLAGNSDTEWGKRLKEAMQAANADLRQLVSDRESNMATTMVATVIHDGIATMANVGDSRGYHWRNGQLKQITKDQSLVAKLVEEGAITEEEAIHHPRKNVILHSLGSRHTPQIDVFEVPLEPADLLLLCSDGLIRHVTDNEINDIIAQQTVSEAAATLIQMANERGGEDNITVAILRYTGDSAMTRPGATMMRTVVAPTVLSPPRPAATVVTSVPKVQSQTGRRALWLYTILLCLAQTIAIFLAWLALRV